MKHMTPREHYTRANEILHDLVETNKAVAAKIEEVGAFGIDPSTAAQINANQTYQMRLAQIHATMATVVLPGVS